MEEAKELPEAGTPLIPMPEFQEVMKRVLAQSKAESDAQLEHFQAANAKRRMGSKRGRKPKKTSS